MILQAGRLAGPKSIHVATAFFLEMIRRSHTIYPQLTGSSLWALIAAMGGPNLIILGPIRKWRVYRVRIGIVSEKCSAIPGGSREITDMLPPTQSARFPARNKAKDPLSPGPFTGRCRDD